MRIQVLYDYSNENNEELSDLAMSYLCNSGVRFGIEQNWVKSVRLKIDDKFYDLENQEAQELACEKIEKESKLEISLFSCFSLKGD